MKSHIAYLASDKLCGRLPTSKGEKLAARYIQSQFNEYGLKPLASLDTYYHTDTIPTEVKETKRTTWVYINSLKTIKLRPKNLALLNPLPKLTFQGKLEPISDKSLFTESTSLAGRVVVLHVNDTPFFDQFPDTGLMSLLTLSAEQAQRRGAEALFVSLNNPLFFGPRSSQSEHEKQSRAELLMSWFGHLSLPLGMIGQDTWTRVLDTAGDKPITIRHRSTNQIDQGTYTNVVGVIPGQTDASIVVGAHFDHLGSRSKKLFSCYQIYSGADDNASGTAVMMQLAKHFAESETKPQHTLIFAAFSAEELGLIGSKSLAKHLQQSGINVKAMVNFDMLGHPTNPVEVRGSELSPAWRQWFKNNTALGQPAILKTAGFYPRSDHGSFIELNVPSVFFSTGVHDRYHQTTDQFEHINFDGMQHILRKGASFVRWVDQQKTIDYIPQLRADITQWKIGDFDVIDALYDGSLLSKKLPPFEASPEVQFEWRLGLSEPPRKTALAISKTSKDALLIEIDRYQNFQTAEHSEKILRRDEITTLTLPLGKSEISVQIEAISQ